MKSYKMFIGGKWTDAESGKTYTVFNPSTEEEIAQVPLGDKRDVDKAVEAARKALPVWSKKIMSERLRILKRLSEILKGYAKELTEISILDHGTPISWGKGDGLSPSLSFDDAAEICKQVMGVGESRLSSPAEFAYLQREPIGVVACIEPWNGPLAAMGKIWPALASGNTCILKPASVESLPSLRIFEILSEHEHELPPGAINVVTGPGSTVGEAIASHPGIGMIAFTGSSEAGKRIMSLASQTVKRFTMELGGKNPFIVLENADVDLATRIAAKKQTFNTGQICSSPGRYYIHKKIYDEFVSKVISELKKVVVGDPNDEKTDMGPVVSAEHRNSIEAYIKSGIEEGAKLVLGGKRPTTPPFNRGYWVMPTVFIDVKPHMKIYREEIFGPVLCITKFSSEDEVLQMANDNKYGLGASVWTKDLAKGRKFADALQAGTVWINNHGSGGPLRTPWGGYKESGIGKDRDIMGFEGYTQIKVISYNTNTI
jgi:betaine-aldehyde dehydrogenase